MNDLVYLRGRLKDLRLTYPSIAAQAGVKTRWLRAFVDGTIPEPGYIKVQQLWRFLAILDGVPVAPSVTLPIPPQANGAPSVDSKAAVGSSQEASTL